MAKWPTRREDFKRFKTGQESLISFLNVNKLLQSCLNRDARETVIHLLSRRLIKFDLDFTEYLIPFIAHLQKIPLQLRHLYWK